MAPPDRLADDEIARRLTQLPGWTVKDGKLHREFSFPDFIRAFAFRSGAALRAEALGHHPEWFNVCETLAELVVARPPRSWVVSAGRVVARDGHCLPDGRVRGPRRDLPARQSPRRRPVATGAAKSTRPRSTPVAPAGDGT